MHKILADLSEHADVELQEGVSFLAISDCTADNVKILQCLLPLRLPTFIGVQQGPTEKKKKVLELVFKDFKATTAILSGVPDKDDKYEYLRWSAYVKSLAAGGASSDDVKAPSAAASASAVAGQYTSGHGELVDFILDLMETGKCAEFALVLFGSPLELYVAKREFEKRHPGKAVPRFKFMSVTINRNIGKQLRKLPLNNPHIATLLTGDTKWQNIENPDERGDLFGKAAEAMLNAQDQFSEPGGYLEYDMFGIYKLNKFVKSDYGNYGKDAGGKTRFGVSNTEAVDAFYDCDKWVDGYLGTCKPHTLAQRACLVFTLCFVFLSCCTSALARTEYYNMQANGLAAKLLEKAIKYLEKNVPRAQWERYVTNPTLYAKELAALVPEADNMRKDVEALKGVGKDALVTNLGTALGAIFKNGLFARGARGTFGYNAKTGDTMSSGAGKSGTAAHKAMLPSVYEMAWIFARIINEDATYRIRQKAEESEMPFPTAAAAAMFPRAATASSANNSDTMQL